MREFINSFILFVLRVFASDSPAEAVCLERKKFLRSDDGFACFYFLSYHEHRSLLLQIKRGDDGGMVRMSHALCEELLRIRGEFFPRSSEKTLLIPLPLSFMRILRRGFNQSHRILEEALRHDRDKKFKLETKNLVKVRETRMQSLLSERERKTEQRGVFNVRHPERLRGEVVFLFDDIVTTGSTLYEARKVLLKAGAKDVVCIALAH
jgi:ComF family protein